MTWIGLGLIWSFCYIFSLLLAGFLPVLLGFLFVLAFVQAWSGSKGDDSPLGVREDRVIPASKD